MTQNNNTFSKYINLNTDTSWLIVFLLVCGFIMAILDFGFKFTISPNINNNEFQTFLSYLNLGKSSFGVFSMPWKLATYVTTEYSIFKILSNILWLWLFAGSFEKLVGQGKLFYLFIISSLSASIFISLFSIFIDKEFYFFGPTFSIFSLGMALWFLYPKYNFFLTENIKIPIFIIVPVFALFSYLNISNQPIILSIIGYVIAGFSAYIFVYYLKNKLPFKTKIRNSKSYNLDDVLDKINRKGINSLSKAEKQFLDNHSKTN